MDSELYLDLNTFVHRLDPRTKIFFFVTVFASIIFIDNPVWLLPMTILILLEGLVSHTLINLKRIRHVLIVLAISTLVMWSIFIRGQTTIFWIYSVESIVFSVSRVLLILSFITAGMIFISTTRNEEFVLGMIRLGLPYRVGFAIATSLRLVPTIVANAVTIVQAQRSRGLDLQSGTPLERVRKYIPLLIPVFISTIRGTNVFAMALESKGFGARTNRTNYLQWAYHTVDYVCLVFFVILFVFYTYIRIAGYGALPGVIR